MAQLMVPMMRGTLACSRRLSLMIAFISDSPISTITNENEGARRSSPSGWPIGP